MKEVGLEVSDYLFTIIQVLDCPSHYLDGRKIDPKRAQAQRKDGKLFVGGIDPETKDEKIKEHFSKFGEVKILFFFCLKLCF